MKNRIKVEVPLSGSSFGSFVLSDTLTVAPPCFYCGAPVDTNSDYYYTQQGEYQIQYWGRGRKFGTPMLGDVVDASGNKLKGKYALKFPYCPEHIHPVKSFKTIDIIMMSIGALLGLVITAFVVINEGADAVEILIMLFGLGIFGAMLFYLLGLGIKAIIAKTNPKLKDYPLGNGHYGVEISGVRVNGGAPMSGSIRYTLTLGFCDPEGARRFLAANPRAKVTKGENLLAR